MCVDKLYLLYCSLLTVYSICCWVEAHVSGCAVYVCRLVFVVVFTVCIAS